ncbi:Leucine--tRNA ligase [Candidatus Promineifilum breve]|uniref:Leucine--tRNA ligase n=1 Tax=Candidatus Promineifilum breve TaxID=1806508 RepID=A0A161JML8_9CHLR|nr:leucine--tRNA ligase [Candidatus Promineifilum breve]CUS05353.2 Leucine--tRNA ligase [Candidatus Promineifilum breve]
MSDSYDPASIEPKWQAQWEADGLYRSQVDWTRPKHYALTMLPYPSGDLHIGHWFAMTPSDARARFMRMRGYNVLFPMGFDAFGLPAETAAIQRNIHPKTWTYANIERMRRQLRSMGAMFDWQREAVSCDPAYYRWTEWFFTQLYDHALAYRGEGMVNWSETLQTVLANEQVIDGKDERTGQPVIQKLMEQWFFAITRYSEELLSYPGLDWPEPVKLMQTNWIGRSEGARVVFTAETGDAIEVFTTRPDTLWGATFMVLAPEHDLVDQLTTEAQRAAVTDYRAQAARATEIERLSDTREKTGVFTGGYAVNPVNGSRIPVWIADYVLSSYGTGAIMAVPAHDQRDFDFARRYGLAIIPVIQPEGEALDGATMATAYVGPGVMVNSAQFDGTPVTAAKGFANPSVNAVGDWLAAEGLGGKSVNFRMRDWLISRQRYWGAPIPAIYSEDGSIAMTPDAQLPVLLPDDVEFMPTGQSPLHFHDGFLHTVDSSGRPARRETDTMDTFMCSSWYQYRYLSPRYEGGPFDPVEAAYWLPVDVYTGGAEHATMHLLYTRFFTKAMRDLGLFAAAEAEMRAHGRDPRGQFDEPMIMLRNQGQILGAAINGDTVLARGRREGSVLLAEHVAVVDAAATTPGVADNTVSGEIMKRTENVLQIDAGGEEWFTVEVTPGAEVDIPSIEGHNNVNQLRQHLEIQRMSKSKGNVVNPDELVAQFGADTVRAYLMFFAKWDQGGPWNYGGIKGPQRLLQDVWEIGRAEYAPTAEDDAASRALRRKTHQTIRKVTQDLDEFSFNTAVAALMELRNTILAARREANVGRAAWDEAVDSLLLLLAPVSPHITEELWARRGRPTSIHQQAWPAFDETIAREEVIELVIQLNGKTRDKIEVPAGLSEDELRRVALESEKVRRMLDGRTPRKVIIARGSLVNIVA